MQIGESEKIKLEGKLDPKPSAPCRRSLNSLPNAREFVLASNGVWFTKKNDNQKTLYF